MFKFIEALFIPESSPIGLITLGVRPKKVDVDTAIKNLFNVQQGASFKEHKSKIASKLNKIY